MPRGSPSTRRSRYLRQPLRRSPTGDLRFVDGAERVAFLFHTPVPGFENALRLAGSHFEKALVLFARRDPVHSLPFVLLLSPPEEPRSRWSRFVPISRRGGLGVCGRGPRRRQDVPRWTQPRRGMWYEAGPGEPKDCTRRRAGLASRRRAPPLASRRLHRPIPLGGASPRRAATGGSAQPSFTIDRVPSAHRLGWTPVFPLVSVSMDPSDAPRQ